MKVTKYGHCCLLVETGGVRLLTDPGCWSTLPEHLGTIDAVLLTHEHQDHLHVPSLSQVLAKNPKAVVLTNSGVGALLQKEGITYKVLEHGQSKDVGGVLVEAFGVKHADIYETVPVVPNTGFFIDNRLFYPGDALTAPARPPEILALPVCGPWLLLADAVRYALDLQPKVVFPVHDGMLAHVGAFHRIPEGALTRDGVGFVVLEPGKTHDFGDRT